MAGVFYNRLASDRPYLESDATTAYEVGREPTAEEVHAETPYSTYANAGLPPTPICSPGIESLTAVCEPTQTEDMLFDLSRIHIGRGASRAWRRAFRCGIARARPAAEFEYR